MGLNILWVILSLAAVLGLFFILVYAMKKLNNGVGYVNGNRMKVIDRISLGKDTMLAVVLVAGKLMLLGVSGQHIEKLADLDMTPEEYNENKSSSEAQDGATFQSAFSEMFRKRKSEEQEQDDD